VQCVLVPLSLNGTMPLSFIVHKGRQETHVYVLWRLILSEVEPRYGVVRWQNGPPSS